MKLLDLPTELTRDIVDEMVETVGLYQSVKLRRVCRMFDELILDNFSRDPEKSFKEHIGITISPPFFARTMYLMLKHDSQRNRPWSVLCDEVVDLVIGSHPTEPADPARVGNTRFSSQREELLDVLCQQMSQNGCSPSIAWNPELAYDWTVEDKILAALTAAAATGNIPAMERLIDQYSYDEWCLASENEFFGVPLSAATFHGQLEATLFLLDLAAKRDFKPNEGWCHTDRQLILRSLYCSGHLDIVNIAFIPRYELRYTGRDFERAILEAIRNRHGTIALYLFARVEGIDNRASLREDMFQYAARYGCDHIITALMEGSSCRTLEYAIQSASWRGETKVLQLLLDGGLKADPWVLNDALIAAVKREDYDVVRVLLDGGVDINYSGPETGLGPLSFDKDTAIGVALSNHQPRMVKFLLERDTNTNASGVGVEEIPRWPLEEAVTTASHVVI